MPRAKKPDGPAKPDLVRFAEFHSHLPICPKTFRRWIADGIAPSPITLPGSRSGRRTQLLWPRSVVNEFLKKLEAQGLEAANADQD
jgi:hypothetical protein